jgi:hypothetical protein
MVITSAGIYGFLSNAYQSTANKLEIHEGELGVLDAKKATFEKSVVDNQKLIDTKTKRLDQLSNLRSSQESRLDNSGSNRAKNSVRGDIKSADSEIQKLNTEIDVLNAKNIVLSDSINAYNVKAIELKSGSSVAAEVGPLKFIAQLTGISMASVVNYLILLLIFVFDPLAVALVLITNKVFQIEKEEEDETKKILEDIVEVLNNEDEKNVEVQNEPNYNKFEYKSPRVSTIEYDNDVLEEPIEFSDDETIEQPIFENIIDPVDELIIDGESGEIKFPEKPLEINQEVFLPSPQEKEEDEEEYDESHALDMVMNHILGDYEEVVEVENEVAKVEEEVAVVEEEILPIEEENLNAKGKITLEEIKERMKRWDELSIIEELDIQSNELVERFEDYIEDQVDRLEQLLQWEDE